MSAHNIPETFEAANPGYHVWRADRDGEPGSWMATRLDEAAGTVATLMEPTAEALRAALVEQLQIAARGPDGQPMIRAG
jgi:hypothetical protein